MAEEGKYEILYNQVTEVFRWHYQGNAWVDEEGLTKSGYEVLKL
jgi:hypothetical protein